MPAGFGLGLGMMVMPLGIVGMILRQKGQVGRFIQAGAISPDTARRPSSLGIQTLYLLKPATRRGLLVALEDGRYYANLPACRRQRRFLIVLAILAAIAAATVAYLTFPTPE